MKKSRIVLNGYLLLKIMENYYKNMKVICRNKKYTIKISPKSFLADFSNDYKINGIWIINDNSCSYIDLFSRECMEESAYEDEFNKIKNDNKNKDIYSEVVFKDYRIYININKLLTIEIENKSIEDFINFVDSIDCENNTKDMHSCILKTSNFLKKNMLKHSDYWFETVRDVAKVELEIENESLDEKIIEDYRNKKILDKGEYKEIIEDTEEKIIYKNKLNELKPNSILKNTYNNLPLVLLRYKKDYTYRERKYGKDVKYLFSNIYTNNNVVTEIINDKVGFYSYIKNTNIIDQLYEDAIVLTTVDEDLELEFSTEKRDFEDRFVKHAYYDSKLANRDVEDEKDRRYRNITRNEILEIEEDTLSWGYGEKRYYNSDDEEEQVLFSNIYKEGDMFLAKIKDLNVYIHNVDPKMFITILHSNGYLLVDLCKPEKDTNFVDYSIIKPLESKYKVEVPRWHHEEEAEERRIAAEIEADFWRNLDDYERENLINMMEK